MKVKIIFNKTKHFRILFILILQFMAFGNMAFAQAVDFNGQFIIGIFSVRPVSDMASLKKIGFNCVQTYEKKKDNLVDFIKEAQKQDLYALIYPLDDFKSISWQRRDQVRKFISQYNSDRVIWYVADEPNLEKGGDLIGVVQGLKDVVKSVDRSASVALTSGWWQDYDLAAAIPDIFMIDKYPIGKGNDNDDVRKVSEHTRKAIRAVQQKKPVWVILQAFGYQDEKDSGFGWKREPTYDETRAMTYLAIINGAKGVFYYTYECLGYKIKKSKQHWSDLQSIVAELNSYLPVLTAEASDQIVVEDLSGKNAIEYSVKKFKGKYYLFAVNGTRENVKARIRGKAGVYTENFKPLETKIYVFK